MNAKERRMKLLEETFRENIKTSDFAKRHNFSPNTIIADKVFLKKEGLLESKGRNVSMVIQLTKKGLELIGEDPEQWVELKEPNPQKVNNKNNMLTKDRRMSVLAYLTFNVTQTQCGIGRIIGASQVTIGVDLKVLTKEKFLKKFAGIYTLTEKGLEAIDNYDGNYGRGRIQA